VQSRFIQWVDGRLVEMMIAVDITEIKRAQEEARMNEQQWHFANRLSNMGEMASSLAHELNQPLTAINIYCQGLLKRIDTTQNPPFIIDAIEKAAKQASKAGEIIKKLKQFIHKASFEKKWINIQTIMLDALELIQLSFFKQSNVQLNITQEVNMYVDPVLIEQVLVNLIKNGIESNQQAAINKGIDAKNLQILINIEQIELNSHIIGEQTIQQKFLQICIIDQGIGVAPEHMDKLFDAFYSTKHSGMGMGLKICRSIIESHEGQLIVQNNLTEGCTFIMRLPILNSYEDNVAETPKILT
jgi:signal transduction histidine kinase